MDDSIRCDACATELDEITSFSFHYCLSGAPKFDHYCEGCWSAKDYVPEAGATCFECREAPVDRPDALKIGYDCAVIDPPYVVHTTTFVCSPECARVCHRLIKKTAKSIRANGKELAHVTHNRCKRCQKFGIGFKKCSGCGLAYYCSVSCQKDDWKNGGHGSNCKRRR